MPRCEFVDANGNRCYNETPTVNRKYCEEHSNLQKRKVAYLEGMPTETTRKTCKCCGNSVPDSVNTTVLADTGESVYLCNRCIKLHSCACGCNKVYYNTQNIDGYIYGKLCINRLETEYGGPIKKEYTINSYSTKLDPLFLKCKGEVAEDTLFIGFENEITFPTSFSTYDHELRRVAIYNCQLNHITNIVNEHKLNIYMKSDSSINYGVELVSRAMSFNYFKTLAWDKLFENAQWIKHNSVGMHVHMSKDKISHAQLFKMIKFFAEEAAFIEKIAERSANSYCDKVSKNNMLDKAINKGGSYAARDSLNTRPANTIEIRIFAGATTLEQFIKNVEFVQAFWEWTKQTSIKNINKDKFKEYVDINKDKFPYLFTFINK